MKTAMAVMTILIFALALGAASAMAAGNGITVSGVSLDDGAILNRAPGADLSSDLYVEGSSAGGLRPDRELFNGITEFDVAGAAGRDISGPDIHNGITLFSTEAVSYD